MGAARQHRCTLLYGPAADLHLRVRPLFTEELRLVFRPGFLAETSLTLAEAAEHPLILPSRPAWAPQDC